MYVLSPARSQPTARAAQPAEYEGWPLIAIDYDSWPSNRPARPLQSCAGMPTRAVPSRFVSRPLRPIRLSTLITLITLMANPSHWDVPNMGRSLCCACLSRMRAPCRRLRRTPADE